MTKYWRQNEVWKCSYCNTEMKKSGENYQEHIICLDNYAEFDGNGQIIRGSLYHYGKYDRSFDIIVVCAICTNANCKNYSVSMKLKQFGEGIIREDKEFFYFLIALLDYFQIIYLRQFCLIIMKLV